MSLLIGLLYFPLSSYGNETATEEVPTALEVETKAKFMVYGDIYIPKKAKKAPLVIFIHMLGGKRSDFKQLAENLYKRGFVTITFDLRGHGESVGYKNKKYFWRNFTSKTWADADKDIDDIVTTAMEEYADKINKDKIAIVGAGVGSNIGILYASRHPNTVKTMVLLSPSTQLNGLDTLIPLVNWGPHPLLMIASSTDTYSSQPPKTLIKFAQGETEVHLYKKASFGTDIFKYRPDVKVMIENWIYDRLMGKAKSTQTIVTDKMKIKKHLTEHPEEKKSTKSGKPAQPGISPSIKQPVHKSIKLAPVKK